MTFRTEEVQHTFHALPTDRQLEWTLMEEHLSTSGLSLHIESVREDQFGLEIIIRIDK